MKKLIELDAALDTLKEAIVPAEDVGFGDELTDGYNDGVNMAVTVVSGLPTVDAVEVVRCKDCRYWNDAPADDGYNSCEMDALIRYEGFFCANGERKDDDGNG